MTRSNGFVGSMVAVVMMSGAACSAQSAVVVNPAAMPKVAHVSERFQSYNIEMLEVTGGRFWKPYSEIKPKTEDTGPTPVGMDPNLYSYRGPKDLSNAKLRAMARGLAPAYMRVSGTWANSTYLPREGEVISTPPAGFNGILTRAQWKGVIDFARAANAELVTSFATSIGTRDAKGVWTTEQAQRMLDATAKMGGKIAAAEYMNEPTFAMIGGAPKGYTPADYGRDFAAFRAFAKKQAPGMLVAGPGSVGESTKNALASGMPGFLPSQELMKAMGHDTVDVFSYHAYGSASKRCAGAGSLMLTTPEMALTEGWLSRTDDILAFYTKLRDEYDPGKPMWLTETAETACGGNPWASTFLDSFRYLDQLGRLAKAGVQSVMHNTLAASDYGLLDEKTYDPRPNYWAALLWRRTMGTNVLDAGVPMQAGLHVYASCLRGQPGGVAMLVIQTDTASHVLQVPAASKRYTLSAKEIQSGEVMLNGKPLMLGANNALPVLGPVAQKSGEVVFAPETITFLAMPAAGNAACR